MKYVRYIELFDKTTHSSLDKAEIYLGSKMSSGISSQICFDLYDKSQLQIRDYLFENTENLKEFIRIAEELKEVLKEQSK